MRDTGLEDSEEGCVMRDAKHGMVESAGEMLVRRHWGYRTVNQKVAGPALHKVTRMSAPYTPLPTG